MIFDVICPDHPEVGPMYPADVFLHAAVDHRGVPIQDVFSACVTTYLWSDG